MVARIALAVAVLVALALGIGSILIALDNDDDVRELREETAVVSAQVSRLDRRVDRMQAARIAERPYLRGVSAVCNAFRNVTGLEGSEEYATVVGRALAGGIADSCDYAKVPPGVLGP